MHECITKNTRRITLTNTNKKKAKKKMQIQHKTKHIRLELYQINWRMNCDFLSNKCETKQERLKISNSEVLQTMRAISIDERYSIALACLRFKLACLCPCLLNFVSYLLFVSMYVVTKFFYCWLYTIYTEPIWIMTSIV